MARKNICVSQLCKFLSQHVVIQFRGQNVNIVKNGRNRFLHSSLLKIWDFFHSCEKFYVFSLVPLRSTREKWNFSHSWKKFKIFNRDSCKNLLFFCPLYCLCFFNLRLLIISQVSSKFSYCALLIILSIRFMFISLKCI